MPKYREGPKSELDSQRALLDSLMGINRNNDRFNDQINDYRDERICKYYLVGMCPNEIFVNTKMDEGPCQKLHSDLLKEKFEKSKDFHMYDSMIEREFGSRVSEVDRVIKRARARVEDEKADEAINPEINPDILRINSEISKVISAAEVAGEKENNIDLVHDLILVKLEELTKERTAILNKINELKRTRPGGPDKKLRVCDVCGCFLSIFDSDKRLTDHFLGKQHIGFQYMRDTLDAIRKRKDEKRDSDHSTTTNNHRTTTNNSRDRGSSRSRDRRERHQMRGGSRDRDRGNNNDRGNNRDRRRDDSRDRYRSDRDRR